MPTDEIIWPEPQATAPEGARLVTDLVDVDLAAGHSFAAGPPQEAFDTLRSHGGIAWHGEPAYSDLMGGEDALFQFVDGPGFWAVTSHELVSRVDKDQKVFSSEAGGTIIPSLTEESLVLFRQMMLNMDHPRHTRLRRILQPVFTPRSIQGLTDSIDLNAAEILQDLEGEFDLVTEVAAEMPLRVLADLFGMPREDRKLIFDWSNALMGASNPGAGDPDNALIASEAAEALASMMAYGQAMVEDRRANPRDDIVSRIANAELDGERLTDEEFQMFWLLLVIAGNETTRNALSGSVLALAEHDLWRWLGDNPDHDPTAIDELLRHVSPVNHFRRTAMVDVTLGDQQVRAGDKVVIWFGSANRDPEVFGDPHGLDLRRDPNPHLAFGVGPHFCLGSHLARMEMTKMLRSLLDAAPNLEVGEPTRLANNFINGIAHLPVRWDRS